MAKEVCIVKPMFFCPSSHVWMLKLDHKEDWVLKNWCFGTVVLKKTLESPLNSKEIKPVNLKGNQPWILIWMTDAVAEAPIFWPPDAKSWLIWKDPDTGKDWRREEKGTTEDEMVGWHHSLNGHEFEQALEVGLDREAWRATVHGVTKSWTWLSNWTELNYWKPRVSNNRATLLDVFLKDSSEHMLGL